MNNSLDFNRRTFLLGAGAAAATASGTAAARPARVIDAHDHLHFRNIANWSERDRQLIEAADKLGIDQICCSIVPPEHPMTLEGFRNANRWVAEGMRRFPGRVLGQCIVNPGYGPEAMEEIRRYIGEGFIGIKLYNDYRINEPVVRPIIELAIELKVPILQHAGHTSWLSPPQPRISDGSHVAEAANRYPEAMIICGHICGGGDWEWTIKSLRNAPTAFLDTSGSVIDDGVVEMAVSVLGASRLLFACDTSLTASVGRMRSAEIDDASRRKIMGENMQQILARGGRA
ncbi:MAG: amidohydrolase family protein [Bryobacterales bacterium]|nr:amidohydrolase family protein [Bryobacterales bacterium]